MSSTSLRRKGFGLLWKCTAAAKPGEFALVAFFLAFKHKVEVVTCSAAALTCMKYAVNILPHLSHSTPEKCLHLPRLEHGGSAGWVDRCSAHQPL